MQTQMYAMKEICGICNEAITNPICPECLEKEIKTWLKVKNPNMVNKVMGVTSIFSGFEYSSMNCVLCGKSMNICAHCYVKEIYEILSEYDKNLAQDFKFTFNFDLAHEENEAPLRPVFY